MEYGYGYRDIWNTLSKIDVSEHTEVLEKKNKKTGKITRLTYLSWAWAWGTLMEHYPDASYQIHALDELSDGSALVSVTVNIGQSWRYMWLPVMDYNNNAINKPNSREVSDATMRCLVKCLAMFGLGHYIYAGEDLPTSSNGGSDAEREELENSILNMFEEFLNDCNSAKDLREFWDKNEEEAKKLSRSNIAKLKELFKNKNDELERQDNG